MSVTTAERRARPWTSTREANRSPVIYGIRGLAALALVFTHVAMVSGLLGTREAGPPRGPSNYLGGFFASGFQICVGIFFLMTGLFLYRPFAKSIISGRRHSDRGNFLRRVLRLLPAYYAVYVISLLVLNSNAIEGVWYVLKPILLLQVYDWTWMNGMEVTWTVPAMVQFYLALPLIAWATHRYAARGATPKARAYRLMLPVPILVAIGFGWLFFVKATDMGTRALFWWPMGLAPEVGLGMGLGILLALSQVSPKDTPKLLRVAAAHPNMFLFAALATLIVNAARPFSEIGMDDIYTVPGLLVFYVLLAVFSVCAVLPLVVPGAKSQFIRVTLANKPIVYAGRVSYGIYLWHFPVMHFYLQPGNILDGQPLPIFGLYGNTGFWELEIATVVLTVIVASISYYLLERPLMDWGERYIQRREQRRGRTTAPTPPQRASVPV